MTMTSSLPTETVARRRQASDQFAPTKRAQGLTFLRLLNRVRGDGTRWFSLEHAGHLAGQRSISGKVPLYSALGWGIGLAALRV